MKIEASVSVEDKKKWKIVRTDTYTDVAGEIIAADEATGECSLLVATADRTTTETKTLTFGPGGIRIVGRRR